MDWSPIPISYAQAVDYQIFHVPEMMVALAHPRSRLPMPLLPDPAPENEFEESFVSLKDIKAVNKRVHDMAGTPGDCFLESPGLIDHCLTEALILATDYPGDTGIVKAAAHMAHAIAYRQAFRDGNRRTAATIARAFLHNNGLSYISPLDRHDHTLVRYINGTVEPKKIRYNASHYQELFLRRYENRTPSSS